MIFRPYLSQRSSFFKLLTDNNFISRRFETLDYLIIKYELLWEKF